MVLILVLMEDTLRELQKQQEYGKSCVLILVLMEDTLRDCYEHKESERLWGLNPCFNGRYSQRT